MGARSYSLIRWPEHADDRLHIAVQAEPEGTGGSKAMHALEAGGEIALSDPKNSFALQDTPKPIALIAGGIGVTPLISMATELQEQGRDFAFHYTGRSAAIMAYRAELQGAFGDNVTCYYDDAKPADLAALAETLKGHALYICGPRGMIDAMRSAAEIAGVPADDVHVELFTTPDAVGSETAFEVELASSNEVVTVAADQTIIEALEAAGHDVLYDCQRGDCGICQVDVLAGEPDHRDVVLSEAEKASGKVMQICVSRAKSARLVLDM
ncbi:PDR/VanB family oxidoreductase [Rhodophyticola sp. CCM32]|uniref:PDR/VanB family oxidoreductase n=1 Tax=Rhodophyticola sp. CCM32 TaxID=2916397 RepID=UPI001EE5F274|nr:PDR/VanB family oxidoreductase [Rhodophyticola sp. CCM32]